MVASCVQEVVDGIAEAGPFGGEGVQGLLAGGGRIIKTARRAAGGFPPGGRYQPVAAQAAQQRVDGAFAGHHPVDLAELADQVEAVAFAAVEQGQHAVLEGSSPELGEEGGARGFYHAVHSTRRSITLPARGKGGCWDYGSVAACPPKRWSPGNAWTSRPSLQEAANR